MIIIPGLNSLIENNGVKRSYLKVLEKEDYKVLSLTQGNIEKQLKEIYTKTKDLFSKNVGFFGGDHSISYPLCSNFFKKYGKDSKLIVFDAHPDLMKPLIEPTHEEWLRALIEKGFPSENILLVGIRRNSKNIDAKEIDFANKRGIEIIYPDEFTRKEKKILNFAKEGNLYISLDVDVLDSSVVDFTGYPEKNGLSLEKLLSILSKIKKVGNIHAYDFVEVNLEKGRIGEKKALEVTRKILKTLDFD